MTELDEIDKRLAKKLHMTVEAFQALSTDEMVALLVGDDESDPVPAE